MINVDELSLVEFVDKNNPSYRKFLRQIKKPKETPNKELRDKCKELIPYEFLEFAARWSKIQVGKEDPTPNMCAYYMSKGRYTPTPDCYRCNFVCDKFRLKGITSLYDRFSELRPDLNCPKPIIDHYEENHQEFLKDPLRLTQSRGAILAMCKEEGLLTNKDDRDIDDKTGQPKGFVEGKKFEERIIKILKKLGVTEIDCPILMYKYNYESFRRFKIPDLMGIYNGTYILFEIKHNSYSSFIGQVEDYATLISTTDAPKFKYVVIDYTPWNYNGFPVELEKTSSKTYAGEPFLIYIYHICKEFGYIEKSDLEDIINER